MSVLSYISVSPWTRPASPEWQSWVCLNLHPTQPLPSSIITISVEREQLCNMEKIHIPQSVSDHADLWYKRNSWETSLCFYRLFWYKWSQVTGQLSFCLHPLISCKLSADASTSQMRSAGKHVEEFSKWDLWDFWGLIYSRQVWAATLVWLLYKTNVA